MIAQPVSSPPAGLPFRKKGRSLERCERPILVAPPTLSRAISIVLGSQEPVHLFPRTRTRASGTPAIDRPREWPLDENNRRQRRTTGPLRVHDRGLPRVGKGDSRRPA